MEGFVANFHAVMLGIRMKDKLRQLTGLMSKIWIITFSVKLGFLLNPLLSAQSFDQTARSLGLGGAGIAAKDPQLSLLNPAALGQAKQRHAGFHAMQAYGLAALRYANLSLTYPTSFAVMGGGIATFGFEAYRETQFQIRSARAFKFKTSRTLQFGFQAQYQNVSIANYGQAHAFGLNLGLQTALTNRLQMGFIAQNITRSRYAEDVELPRVLGLGFAYEPEPNFIILADFVKDLKFPLAFRGGLAYRPVTNLILRGGFGTAPVHTSVGLGIEKGRLSADLAAEYHQVLGLTPAFSFGIQF